MKNKAENAVQSYAAGIGVKGAKGQGGRKLGGQVNKFADPRQCSCRTILPVGLKDRRMRLRRRRRRRRKMVVPRADSAYGRQLNKREGMEDFQSLGLVCTRKAGLKKDYIYLVAGKTWL